MEIGRPVLSISAAAALCVACSPSAMPSEGQAQVEVSGWSWGFSYTGDYCEGRGFVRNRGPESLGRISFEVRLLDKQERIVARGRGRMEKPMLEPGEASPFSFFLPCPVSSSAAELTATHGLGAPVAIMMKP